jgi:DNA helicase-2/ATP-dependent DNA helicase PcrA
MDLLKGLNPPQREAVTHVEGPLLILAGAGSGKTRVITHRIAYLIRQHGVHPGAILAVTFTNKAAKEMRDRVVSLIEGAVPTSYLNLATFHSFCVRVLRRDGDNLAQIRPGFTRNFTIYDDDDQVALIKAAYKKLGLDEKFMKYRGALSVISNAKSDKVTPDEMAAKATDPASSKLAVIYEEYEKGLRTANALDFDDLLLETVRLLRHDRALRQRYNQRLTYLMVDEYQDTNRSQYEMMRLLSEAHDNVCCVGDEDQSIYSWRGADIRNILDFERDYRNAKTIRLEQNYRSTKNILAAAGTVVANNTERKGKTLWTDGPPGDLITLYTAYDAENEALYIADMIQKYTRRDPNDRMAVLYRTNSQSRQIEEALRRYGLAYTVVGGFSFYQRAEIKDVLAYLKVAQSPADSIGLLRIINTPARGIGKTTIEQIEQFALANDLNVWQAIERMVDEDHFAMRAHAALKAFRDLIRELMRGAAELPVHEVMHMAVDKTGYKRALELDPSEEAKNRLENLGELANAAFEAGERGETLSDFLDHAALVSDADGVSETARINLLTLHNAKGLEFPIVFLAGLEEGLFPHSRSIDTPGMIEEERRLCYVGMTRAEKRLFVSWAMSRRRFGGGTPEPCMASRFLNEIPKDLVIEEGADPRRHMREVDLEAESWGVRESAARNAYTGRTGNSLDNISSFFGAPRTSYQRGQAPGPSLKGAGIPPMQRPGQQPPGVPRPVAGQQSKPPAAAKPVSGGIKIGGIIDHPKYGRGTIVRKEGDGEDAKLTISFPGLGLKKIIAKYAGLK